MEVNGPTKRATIGILALSLAMLFSLLIPTQTADASPGPCPSYSIQDVFDDPNGNWDGDQVNNSDELYNGMNPCIVDSASFCAGGNHGICSYGYTYSGYYNGYTYTDYTHIGYVQKDVVNNQCHRSTFLFPLVDYDGDGVINQDEVAAGTDPCVYNAPVVAAATIACPYYNANHITAAPGYDWDGDGVTNLVEWRRGTNPCVYNPAVYYQPPVRVQQSIRLPHVVTTYTPPPVVRQVRPLRVVQACPAGYPYFHAANGKCYANPVRNSFG